MVCAFLQRIRLVTPDMIPKADIHAVMEIHELTEEETARFKDSEMDMFFLSLSFLIPSVVLFLLI